ncbi:MAG: hypothetical protein JWO69_713 [Thermoleophilia bacterium]|jgi:uncharacterized membrane protein|nr:hypothetical protein [Thermoleophilia bacterium]
MSASTATSASYLLPSTGPAPGQPLWGEAPRSQPIAPLILMVVLLLLVAAPSALAGGGGSANPITLMKQLAHSTYEITGLMKQTNGQLETIDRNSAHLEQLQVNMAAIAISTSSMANKVKTLNTDLAGVGGAVSESRRSLERVQVKLATTSTGMEAVAGGLGGSLKGTRGVTREFGTIHEAIGGMKANLGGAISAMGTSAPLTRTFASNITRRAAPGGSSKLGVPNVAAGNPVMSVVLPMIGAMQQGGALGGRKDSHTASNAIIGTALNGQFANGVNVGATVQPYDNFYGLPGPQFFVQNRIYGF